MENWLVQQLRFSAFVEAASPQLLDGIWALVSTDSPETDDSRPREGFRRLTAVAEDGSLLEVILMPGRFDVLQSPAAGAEILPVVHLGEASPRVDSFVSQIRAMLSRLNADIQIQRIALGLALIRPTASREESYRELQRLLPVELNPETSRDFLYQINHPETMQVGQDSLELNRLSRWSAMRAQHFKLQFAASPSGASVSTQTGLAGREDFVRCEVDNSTAADRVEALPRDSILMIFGRLVELANTSSMGERHATS